MKRQNRVSQLTLELYYRGLATNKERRLAEKALETDSKVRERYEALQEADLAICRLVAQELKRLNVPERLPAPSPRKRKAAGFLIAAAALVLCALIPALLYLKNGGSTKENTVAEESAYEINTNETNTEEETGFIEDKPNTEIAVPPEKPLRGEGASNARSEIAENPRTEPKTAEPELRIDPNSGVSVAEAPTPDTGVKMRGGEQSVDQPGTVPEEPSNINIPPGITSIFDNMFANRNLTFVIIPSRITSIGKNAFAGNPLVSVSIGANVSIADNSIPGNFAAVYNTGGKAAGTYTRTGVDSEEWGRK